MNTPTINPIYLAGVMDSDGSFTITKRHLLRKNINYTIMVQLTWSRSPQTEAVIKQIVNQYGGSFFCGIPNSKYTLNNTKEIIKYCSTGKAAEKLIDDIAPYLLLKRDQALNLKQVKLLVDPLNRKDRSPELNSMLEELYIRNKK